MLGLVKTLLPLGAALNIWHGLEGFLEEKFNDVIDDFNKSQTEHVVQVQKIGNYQEVVEEGMKTDSPPNLLQVYEVATLDMMERPDLYTPVYQIIPHETDSYVPIVRGFYSKNDEMFSLPWNASTGIMYYNKTLFDEKGLEPPKTWADMRDVLAKLDRPFTTAWPAAYHLEHLSGLHNIPFATNGNGMDGSGELVFNSTFHVDHLENIVQMQKEGLFTYTGRFADGERAFGSGEVAILLQGANRLGLIKRLADFEIGVAPLPYYDSVVETPYNVSIGGASFWVTKNEDGVAELLTYLGSSEVQAKWHQVTGYLPISSAAAKSATTKAGKVAVEQVLHRPSSTFTRGIRLPNYMQIRENIMHHLEMIFSYKETPQEGLDLAVCEGNKLLDRP
ncbi:MAG: sn-glycerol-3-phosphate-binding periplasmic protein UgpB [Chlamydiia bacterium]|nr:sn-glycerol-3-phosphate-binding periplasmic protein UgpB [Chlamydiia bacterium]MCH9615664.1 sn-glycerol-3-phosphate-binding periplasmic protein UgpB [Chlamydiia bacterium]MCH9628933.1 sn-glycerol-3-phosphate-binding periplasmic protein UgpB [Chlamydiia bacterium]